MPPSIEKDHRPQTTAVRTNQVAPVDAAATGAGTATAAAVKTKAPPAQPQDSPPQEAAAAVKEPPQAAVSSTTTAGSNQRNASPATKPGAVHASGGSAAHAKAAPASSAGSPAPSQLSQLERDVQAKKAAAPAGAQAAASRPGAVNVDPNSDGLEMAVMKKVRGAANAATSSSPPSQLSQLERDARTKQQARGRAGGVAASTPGAVRASGGSAAHAKPASTSSITPSPSQLSQLERDVRAKKAATGPPSQATNTTSRPGAVTVDSGSSDGLESAVMRKSRAATAVLSSNTANRKPPPSSYAAAAPGQLSQFERDVQAKNGARAGSVAAASMPGALLSNDDAAAQSLDDAIARKVRGEQQGSSRAPPPSQLSRLESDAAAKAAARRPPAAGPGTVAAAAGRPQPSSLNSFEAAVSQKIRAANRGGQQSLTSSRNQLSQMEEDALAKAGPPSAGRQESGGRTQLRQLECDAKVKASVVGQASSDGRAHLNKLDDNGKDNYDNSNLKKNSLGAGPGLEFGTEGDGATSKEGLAVAVAIEEDEEEAQVDAVAIEYDPDAKPPPFHKTKLFRKSALVAFFFILAAGGAAIAGILLTQDDSVDEVSYRETLGIREEIETLIGAEELESLESPYTKALDWITHKDPMALVPADANFFQRYIMAYIYYATTVKGPWRSCNPPVGMEVDFCYLEVLDKSERYPPHFDKKPSTRWLSTVHECDFAGVKCDANNRILELSLNGANMSGEFPLGIVHLPFLQAIRFGLGSFKGPLPTVITELKHLGEIDLQHNEFTGEIPKEWMQARKLNKIEIRFNQIEGTIPTEIQEMKDLTYFVARQNKLSGPIPTELGNVASLSRLNIGANNLVGTIPTELGQVAGLVELALDQNLLTGSLPSQLGNLTKLYEIRVTGNVHLGGTLPDEFYLMKKMMFVYMNDCNFTGPISPAIANMTSLFIFEIQDNQFTGEIPSSIPTAEMHKMALHNNNFQGIMPSEICDARAKAHIGIKYLMADCALNPSTNEVKVACECCTHCCSSSGEAECPEVKTNTDEWETRHRL